MPQIVLSLAMRGKFPGARWWLKLSDSDALGSWHLYWFGISGLKISDIRRHFNSQLFKFEEPSLFDDGSGIVDFFDEWRARPTLPQHKIVRPTLIFYIYGRWKCTATSTRESLSNDCVDSPFADEEKNLSEARLLVLRSPSKFYMWKITVLRGEKISSVKSRIILAIM